MNPETDLPDNSLGFLMYTRLLVNGLNNDEATAVMNSDFGDFNLHDDADSYLKQQQFWFWLIVQSKALVWINKNRPNHPGRSNFLPKFIVNEKNRLVVNPESTSKKI